MQQALLCRFAARANPARRPDQRARVGVPLLRVALDMRAQLGNRTEANGSLGKLGLDRSVRIKRVRHAINDTRFEDRRRACLYRRRRLGHHVLNLCNAFLHPLGGFRERLAIGVSARARVRRPERLEVAVWLGRRTQRFRTEQEVQTRRFQRLNGLSAMAITKLDVLSGFDPLCVCTRYRGPEGAEFVDFPYHQTVLHHAAGEYVELPGFTEDLSECRTESDLPDSAREYLRFVAEFVGVPIALVGVGPGREQVIWTESAPSATVAANGRTAQT